MRLLRLVEHVVPAPALRSHLEEPCRARAIGVCGVERGVGDGVGRELPPTRGTVPGHRVEVRRERCLRALGERVVDWPHAGRVETLSPSLTCTAGARPGTGWPSIRAIMCT